MKSAPLAITGLGAVTPLGASVRALQDTLSDNLCAIAAREVVIEDVERFTFGAAACAGFEERQVRGPSGVCTSAPTTRGPSRSKRSAVESSSTSQPWASRSSRLQMPKYWVVSTWRPRPKRIMSIGASQATPSDSIHSTSACTSSTSARASAGSPPGFSARSTV